jgi:hypothetical protein
MARRRVVFGTCPMCKRVIGKIGKEQRFAPHMPYERKSQADLLDRGRPCKGSKKTYEEAQEAALEREERRAAWVRSLGEAAR